MTSQTGTQTIAVNILPNVLKIKVNQTMKFGQLIEIIFCKSHTENEARRLVPDLFLFLKKSRMKYKPVVTTFVSICLVTFTFATQ